MNAGFCHWGTEIQREEDSNAIGGSARGDARPTGREEVLQIADLALEIEKWVEDLD